jgi:signal transduction histidine kinase
MPDTKDIQPLVLIADDDATTLLLMGAVLEENGFWVVTAADGQEALERYEGRAPDLVILDLGMPRLGGIEVCQRLRTDDSSIPIMISTSKDDLASIDLAFGAGATDFVTKPHNWPLLTRRVQYLLKSSQAMIELEQTSKYKTEFLHNMSHELRTPMNDVLGMIELMQTTSLSLEQQGYCTTVASSGKALLRIIGNILDFSKVEAGEMTFENIDFFLDDTIQETCDIMSPLAFDKEVDLLASIAADCPDQVHGDLERLQQILANLLSNAIKFTDAGHVKLAVTRTAAEIVHVTVSDTGIGLSSAAQAQVFEPFTQADGSTTRMFGGTGLGLTIARRLAEGMGGRISLTGEEGVGTTFTVALPWSQARYAGPTARPSGSDDPDEADLCPGRATPQRGVPAARRADGFAVHFCAPACGDCWAHKSMRTCRLPARRLNHIRTSPSSSWTTTRLTNASWNACWRSQACSASSPKMGSKLSNATRNKPGISSSWTA